MVRLKSKLERLQFEKNTAFEQKDLLKVASLKKVNFFLSFTSLKQLGFKLIVILKKKSKGNF